MPIYWVPFLITLGMIVFYSSIVLLLNYLQKYITSGPLYTFIGITLMYSIITGVIDIKVELSENVFISLNSTTLIAGVIMTTVLVYLEGGTEKIRYLFASILVAFFFTLVYSGLSQLILMADPTRIYLVSDEFPEVFFSYAFKIALASIITIVIDLLFAIIIFQFIVNRIKRKGIVVPIAASISIISASIIDAVIFPFSLRIIGIFIERNILVDISRVIIVGSIYTLIFSIYTHFNTKGKYYDHLLFKPTFDIITHRKKYTSVPIEIFLQSEKRLEVLHSILGHDLRNSLQVMQNCILLLQRDKSTLENTKYITSMKKAFKNLVRIAEIMHAIAEFQKTSLKAIITHRLNLQLICENVVKRVQRKYPDRAIQFSDNSGTIIEIAYNSLIYTALEEILENAIKGEDLRSTEQTKIEVTLDIKQEKKEQYALIQIKNHGRGIEASKIPILLDPIKYLDTRIGIEFIILKIATDYSRGFYTIENIGDNEQKLTNVKINLPIID